MNLDDLQFENDEDRRKYLADLAKLKRIREEAKNGTYSKPYDTEPVREEEALNTDMVEHLFSDYDEYSKPEYEQEPKVIYRDRVVYRDREKNASGSDQAKRKDTSNGRKDSTKTKRSSKVKDSRDVRSSKSSRNKDDSGIKKERRIVNVYVDQNGNMVEEYEEPKKKKSKWFLWVLLILLIAIIAFLAYKMFFPKTKKEGYYTVAVFGLDSRNGNTGKDALSDVNIIARVDYATGEVKLASLYRDTYVKISEDNVYHKLNEAYFRGGPERAVWMIEDNLDIEVDDYAAFNWKAVVDTINILGGVDIEITEPEFRYINGFITETVNSTGVGSYQLEAPGMQHLDGVQAVAYARLRLMDTDYNRTERQRKVIGLAFEKAKHADFATLNCIMETVLPEINTSVTLNDMIPFAKNITDYYLGETCGWPYERKEGDIADRTDVVIPVTLESNVIALHEFLWPGQEYTPSDHVRANSQHIIEVSGVGGDGSSDIKIDDGLDGTVGNTSSSSGGGESVQETEAQPEPEISEASEETTAEAESETEESLAEPLPEDEEETSEEINLEGPGSESDTEEIGPGSGESPQTESDAPAEPEGQAETAAGGIEIVDVE